MSYQERIHKYNIEKNRKIKSPEFAMASPQERDAMLAELAKKWKV